MESTFFYCGNCFSKRKNEYKRRSTINEHTIVMAGVMSVNKGSHAKINAASAVKFPENPFIG